MKKANLIRVESIKLKESLIIYNRISTLEDDNNSNEENKNILSNMNSISKFDSKTTNIFPFINDDKKYNYNSYSQFKENCPFKKESNKDIIYNEINNKDSELKSRNTLDKENNYSNSLLKSTITSSAKQKILKPFKVTHLICTPTHNYSKNTIPTNISQEVFEKASVRDVNDNAIKNVFASPFSNIKEKQITEKIFEQFITIGIEDKGLEYITDLDNMLLAPKILYNYPNMVLEHELK